METSHRCWCEGDNVTLFAQMGNVSEGGTFVRTYAPLAEGTGTRVRFSLEGGPVIEARATVMWRRLSGGPGVSPGMGLRFDEVDETHRGPLREFVAAAQAERGEG